MSRRARAERPIACSSWMRRQQRLHPLAIETFDDRIPLPLAHLQTAAPRRPSNPAVHFAVEENKTNAVSDLRHLDMRSEAISYINHKI
jgi:hypothetical protein